MSRGRKPLPNPYGFSKPVIGMLRWMEQDGRRPTKLAMKCLANEMHRTPVREPRTYRHPPATIPIEVQRKPVEHIRVTYEDAMARKSL